MHTRIKLIKLSFFIALLFAFNGILLANIILPSGGKDGSYWRPGSVQHISWDKMFLDTTKNINIYLWNGDSSTLTLIGSNILSTLGYYNWNIPSNQVLGEHFKIRISYSDTVSDFYLISKDFFPISNDTMPLNRNVFIADTSSIVVTVSPHPTYGGNNISVYCDSKFFQIEIYNLLGTLLDTYNFDYTNEYNITLSNLSAGTYMLRIRFLDNVLDKQIIVD